MSLSRMSSDSPSVSLDLRTSGALGIIVRYLLPFVAVAIAIGATRLLGLSDPESPNLFLFFAAIVVSAWFAGKLSGWLSVFLSTAAVDYFFIPPIYVLDLSAKDIPWLVTFALCSIITNALSLQRRRAEALLVEARDVLEVRVRQRTLDLQAANAQLAAEISQHARAEALLRQAQNELTRAARIATVTELTASIAHELNQPLAAIMSNAEAALNWLRRNPPSLAETMESVVAIVTAGERASEIISRTRSLIKKGSPVFTRMDINELVSSVLALAKTAFTTQEIVIEFRLASGLRPVLGDRVQLQQLLLNLANNAAEAMADVSGRIRKLVISTERSADDHIAVIFEDSGCGLEGADATMLFLPFYSTKQDGTGMGLSICRTIVELHGGEIRASSGSCFGTIFRVELPVGVLL